MAEFALPAPKDYDPDTGLPIPPKAPAPRAAISDYAKSLASGVVNTNLTAPGQLSVLAGGSSEQRAHGQDIERRLLESMSPEGAQVAANKVVNPDFSIGETPIQSVLMSAAQSVPSMVQSVQFGAPIARAAAQARVGERVTAGLGSMPGAATVGRLVENAPFGVIEGVQAGAQNSAQVGQQIRDPNQTPDDVIAQSPEFQKALIDSINANPALPAQDHIKAAREAVAAAAERDVFGNTVPVTGGIGVLTGGGVLPRLSRPLTGATREAGETFLKGVARGAREEARQEFLQSGAAQMVQNAAVPKYANPEPSLTDAVLNQAATSEASSSAARRKSCSAEEAFRTLPRLRCWTACPAFDRPRARWASARLRSKARALLAASSASGKRRRAERAWDFAAHASAFPGFLRSSDSASERAFRYLPASKSSRGP